MTSPESFTNPGAVAAAVARSGVTSVYLHVDLDCFAPDEIPDTLMRTPGGPPFASVAATIVELTAAFDVVGFSLVEYVDRGGDTLARLSDLRAVLDQADTSGSD